MDGNEADDASPLDGYGEEIGGDGLAVAEMSADSLGQTDTGFGEVPVVSNPVGMMDAASEDILLTIPAFANASNRAIHEKVLSRYRQLAKATAETRENQERASIMQEHLIHIRSELASAQRVAESKNKELKTETHLGAMAERALGRANQDLHSNDGKLEDARRQLASLQAQITKGTEKLEAFRSSMNWKHEELERWSAAAKQREEDMRALDEYTRSDEQSIRDLIREQERLTGAVTAKRRELDREATETSAKQVELDKCAEEFRALHEERKELILHLEESLASITARDNDIAAQGARHLALRQAMTAKRERIAEISSRLSNLEKENREMDVRQESVARARGEARDRVVTWTARVNTSRDEVETLKGELVGTSHELSTRRAQNAQWEEEIVKRQAAVEAAKAAAEEIKARRVATLAATASVEEAVQKKDAWLKKEAVRVEKMEKEVAGMREAVTSGKVTLAKLNTEVDVTKGEVKGAEKVVKNLRERLAELDAVVARQAEHSYSADFAIAQMERKLARASGEVSDEEKVRLTARIEELQKEVVDAKALERRLAGECKSVKAALQKALFARQALEDKVLELQGKIDEKLIGIRASEDTLKACVTEKEDALVNYDMLRVEVKRLRDALSSKSEEVLTLENRAAQLELSVESRKKEVEAVRTVLRMEAKLAEEERHKLALDLSDRTAKIALLKTRYEVLCAKLRGGGGGEDPGSRVFYILKAAQRREELQREGDELEAALAKREKEVKALRHTLAYLNARNDSFRTAFASVDPSGNEVGAVRALEDSISKTQDAIYKSKREKEKAVAGAEEGERRLTSLGDRIAALTQASKELEAAFGRAVEEKLACGKSTEALEARLDAARNKARSSRPGSSGVLPDEIAIYAQALRDAGASTLYLLGQLGLSVPSLNATLSAAAKERGLRLVSKPPWARVPGTTSSASSVVEDLLASTTAAVPPTLPSAAPSEGSSSMPPVPRTPLRGLSASSNASSGMAPGATPASTSSRAPSPIVYTTSSRKTSANTNAGSNINGLAKRPPLAAKQHQSGGKGNGGLSLGIQGQGLLK